VTSPDHEMHQTIGRLRRDMPRHTAVLTLCDKAEKLERELIGCRSAAAATIVRHVEADKFVPDPKLSQPVRTIDERVADCPVCAARRKKEAKKKQRQRIKKTIPGQR
jgi:hypothetical protein